MTIEQQLRDRLDRDTDVVIGGPDLRTSLREGRRRRRSRRTVAALGSAALLSVGAVGVGVLVGGASGDHTVASDPAGATRVVPKGVPQAAAVEDWVPGTDIDQKMAASIAQDMPSLPTPTDVYPSDGNTAGPIPDERWPYAQDWQAYYKVGTTQLIVVMSVANEDPAHPFSCSKGKGGTLGLDPRTGNNVLSTGPDGTLCTQKSDNGSGTDQYGTWFQLADDSVVGALELVPSGAEPPFAQSDLNRIVQDPSLVCPPPAA